MLSALRRLSIANDTKKTNLEGRQRSPTVDIRVKHTSEISTPVPSVARALPVHENEPLTLRALSNCYHSATVYNLSGKLVFKNGFLTGPAGSTLDVVRVV